MANKIRTSEDEYAIHVLLGMKRMAKRSDYFLGFVPSRDIMRDTATPEEVSAAIEHAIDLLRDRISVKGEE